MVSAVLEMKHIAKSFSGNKVLLDVDLTVEEGERTVPENRPL